MIFKVKDWVILLRASLCSSIDLGRLRACLPARSGTFEAKYWVTPSQPQYQHGSPLLAWHRHLFLCCFGRCFATITLSCQVVTPSQSHYHHGSPVSAAWQRASPPSLLAKLEQRPWQLTMGSLRASLSSQAAIFKVMYRVCEPTRYSFSKHMAFFSQPHNSRCCWRMLSLFPCDFCHCVFSKHMVQQTKTKQSYVTNKQKIHYKTHTAHIEQTTNELKKCWEVMCHTCPGALCAILAQNHPATVAEPWVALMASESGVGIDISVLHELQKLNKCFSCLMSRTFFNNNKLIRIMIYYSRKFLRL